MKKQQKLKTEEMLFDKISYRTTMDDFLTGKKLKSFYREIATQAKKICS